MLFNIITDFLTETFTVTITIFGSYILKKLFPKYFKGLADKAINEQSSKSKKVGIFKIIYSRDVFSVAFKYRRRCFFVGLSPILLVIGALILYFSL